MEFSYPSIQGFHVCCSQIFARYVLRLPNRIFPFWSKGVEWKLVMTCSFSDCLDPVASPSSQSYPSFNIQFKFPFFLIINFPKLPKISSPPSPLPTSYNVYWLVQLNRFFSNIFLYSCWFLCVRLFSYMNTILEDKKRSYTFPTCSCAWKSTEQTRAIQLSSLTVG